MMQNAVVLALLGTGFTFFMTAVGSGTVFLIKKENSSQIQKIFLGFAAGVMIAASVWSLLLPAIDMAIAQGKSGWIQAAGGFLLGGIFLFLLDHLIPHLHPMLNETEGMPSSLKRTTLLVLAVTLHNIPEGMAVGLAFGLAAKGDVTLASATALAVGIGLQNFPEGAAISLPLKQEGLSKMKSFVYGALSGIVEPIAGLLGVLLVYGIMGVMPWMLAFAAGAMIYVVAEELIPEANQGTHSNLGTIGVMLGFCVMMILDVTLG